MLTALFEYDLTRGSDNIGWETHDSLYLNNQRIGLSNEVQFQPF